MNPGFKVLQSENDVWTIGRLVGNYKSCSKKKKKKKQQVFLEIKGIVFIFLRMCVCVCSPWLRCVFKLNQGRALFRFFTFFSERVMRLTLTN